MRVLIRNEPPHQFNNLSYTTHLIGFKGEKAGRQKRNQPMQVGKRMINLYHIRPACYSPDFSETRCIHVRFPVP